MKRLRNLTTLAAALLFTLLAGLTAAAQKPNIILVMPDDTGYGDYACLGNPIMRTPAVDAFKKECLLFTQFHVSSTCAPTRAALLSGRHEFKNGVTHTILERERMALSTFTLPQMLKTVGYTSGIFGKWHLGDEEAYRPESRGFDEVYIHGGGGIGQTFPGSCGDAPGNTNINPALWHNGQWEKTTGYCTDLFFNQAMKWMDAIREAKEPFFAYIPLNAAHGPHVVPEEYYQHYVGKPGVSEDTAKFFGMLENIDTNFGVLLKKLDDWGIADNTLVIYDYWMATHNNASPSHKNPDNFVRNGKPVGPMEGFSAQLVATEAITWLNDIHDPKQPFVLSVWFHEPHAPIATAPEFSGLYLDHPNRKYLGNVTQMDNGLGMIMDALDEQGLTENTLLFFTSDNGPEGKGGARGGSTGGLRGRKRSDYEGGIRVPGIVRWPGHIKPGTVSDVPVVGSDIFATVLEVTGVALPKDRTIDGVSMVPAFAGQAVERKVPLFWRTHVSPPGDRVAMRIGDWKIVGNDELTTFELYEIQKDAKEEHDLAGKMPDKTAEMKAALLKTWKEIEAEGPKEWWTDKAGGKKGARGLNY